jgi:serine/threonine-protein kinase
MARVHFGCLIGDGGFSRVVAIKRLHDHFASDPAFVATLLDEAKLTSRIQHPNVVPVLDMVIDRGEVFLVMEYVSGSALSSLLRASNDAGALPPWKVATGIVAGALHGLHAAHTACDALGAPLGIVHRDVSPHNILVGTDGLARVVDFGVAKAVGRFQATDAGQIKGKLAYMAPEQLLGQEVSAKADIYGAALVLSEALTGKRVFDGDNMAALVSSVLSPRPLPIREHSPDIPAELEALVLRGLAARPEDRFESAREFAAALEERVGVATSRQIGDWATEAARETLAERSDVILRLTQDNSGRSVSPDTILGKRTRRPARPSAESRGRTDATHDDVANTQTAYTSADKKASNVPSLAARPTKRAPLPKIAALVLVVSLGAIAIYGRGKQHDAGEANSTPLASAEATATPGVPVETQPTESVTPLPSATLSPATEPAVVEAPLLPAAAATPRRPPQVAPRMKKASCKTPYVIGADGIERIRPECL